MLTAIQAFYTNAAYATSVHGALGPSVVSSTGVKQGCPLSPTLFGLFLDGLHRFLQQRCPAAGFQCQNGSKIRDLQYADDVLLVDTCPTRLQATINFTSEFCHRIGMQISLEKSSVLAFNAVCNPPHGPTLQCNDVPLDVLQQVKYLGIHISASHGLAASMSVLRGKQSTAGALLSKQLQNLGAAPSVGLHLRLFRACVPPAASYACEIWALRDLPPDAAAARQQLQSAHLQAIRRILGLSPSVHSSIVYAESGFQPITTHWLLRAAGFYNAILEMPESALCRQLLYQQYELSVRHRAGTWFAAFFRAIQSFQYTFAPTSVDLPCRDIPALTFHLLTTLQSSFADVHVCPRSCPSQGASLCTYDR